MMESMIADGVATIDGDRISITEPGRPLMRAVCALFDSYLNSGVGRHSRAV
jgi:oxygen-independent coproporphyrinogen-3 oxidase